MPLITKSKLCEGYLNIMGLTRSLLAFCNLRGVLLQCRATKGQKFSDHTPARERPVTVLPGHTSTYVVLPAWVDLGSTANSLHGISLKAFFGPEVAVRRIKKQPASLPYISFNRQPNRQP